MGKQNNSVQRLKQRIGCGAVSGRFFHIPAEKNVFLK